MNPCGDGGRDNTVSWLGQAGGTKETASIPWHPGSSPSFQGLAQVPFSRVAFPPGTLEPLEFLRTSLGGKFLVYESFLYRKEKAAGEKVYWMCRDQSRLGCRSRAITQGQQVTVMRSHCHLPDLAGLEALRQRERLPRTAQREDSGTDRREWAQPWGTKLSQRLSKLMSFYLAFFSLRPCGLHYKVCAIASSSLNKKILIHVFHFFLRKYRTSA